MGTLYLNMNVYMQCCCFSNSNMKTTYVIQENYNFNEKRFVILTQQPMDPTTEARLLELIMSQMEDHSHLNLCHMMFNVAGVRLTSLACICIEMQSESTFNLLSCLLSSFKWWKLHICGFFLEAVLLGGKHYFWSLRCFVI